MQKMSAIYGLLCYNCVELLLRFYERGIKRWMYSLKQLPLVVTTRRQ